MRQRFDGIQALRGIACLMVVWYHLWVWESRFGAATPFFREARRFGFAGVDLFFVISGFILSCVHASERATPGGAVQFLARRVWRIVPPYWAAMVFSSLALPLALGVPIFEPSWSKNWPHWVFLVPGGQPNAFAIPSWTLAYEMLFYVALAVSFALPRRLGAGLMVGWAAAVFLATSSDQRNPGAAFSPFVLEFLGGCLVAGLIRRGFTSGGALAIGAAVMWVDFAASGIVWLNANEAWGHVMGRPAPRVFVFGVPSILVVYAIAAAEVRGKLRPPRWLIRMGEASYSIYLTHLPVQTLCAVAGMLFAHTRPAHIAWLIGTMGAVLGFGFLFHLAVEKPLWNLMRRKTPRPAPTESDESGIAPVILPFSNHRPERAVPQDAGERKAA